MLPELLVAALGVDARSALRVFGEETRLSAAGVRSLVDKRGRRSDQE